MIGSLSQLGGCGGGCSTYGGVYGGKDLATYRKHSEAARARKDAGKKHYSPSGVHTGNVDVQIAKWCSAESEWLAEEQQRTAEVQLIQSAASTDVTGIPTVQDVLDTTPSSVPVLPIVAFLAIAGIGGFILYRRSK